MCVGNERCDPDDVFFQAAVRRMKSHRYDPRRPFSHPDVQRSLANHLAGIRGEQPVAMLTGQFQCESTLVDRGPKGDPGYDQRIYWEGELCWINAVCGRGKRGQPPDLLVARDRFKWPRTMWVLSKYRGDCEPGELLGYAWTHEVQKWPINYDLEKPAHVVPACKLHPVEELRSKIWNGEIIVKPPLDP